jgi:hypothetical protein
VPSGPPDTPHHRMASSFCGCIFWDSRPKVPVIISRLDLITLSGGRVPDLDTRCQSPGRPSASGGGWPTSAMPPSARRHCARLVACHPGKPTLQRFTAELEGGKVFRRVTETDNATNWACVQGGRAVPLPADVGRRVDVSDALGASFVGAFGDQPNALCALRETARQRSRLARGPELNLRLRCGRSCWHPDSKSLALGRSPKRAVLRKAKSGNQQHRIATPGTAVNSAIVFMAGAVCFREGRPNGNRSEWCHF